MTNDNKMMALLEKIDGRLSNLEGEMSDIKESVKLEADNLAVLVGNNFEKTNDRIEKLDFKTDEMMKKSFNQGYEIKKIKDRLNI